MTDNVIKKSSTYKLAGRLYILGSMKRTKKVVDEYNKIVDEMWDRCELLRGDKGVKKMELTKSRVKHGKK